MEMKTAVKNIHLKIILMTAAIVCHFAQRQEGANKGLPCFFVFFLELTTLISGCCIAVKVENVQNVVL